MKILLLRATAATALTCILFSCTPGPGGSANASAPQANASRSGSPAVAREELPSVKDDLQSRPGLATGWGAQKDSPIIGRSFERASSKPVGTDVIYYNDKAGIAAMAGSPKRVEGMQTAAAGLVEWGVKGRLGFLATYKEGISGSGRRLVAGDRGGSYSIAVRNRSRSTLEILSSVDGLDVMDGRTASFSKRGYLVESGATLEIDGFRTSSGSVAAFKFSDVAGSYANQRHGDTRNVGVIGIAVFTRKNVDPWSNPDTVRRDNARAFAEAP